MAGTQSDEGLGGFFSHDGSLFIAGYFVQVVCR